MSKTTRDRFNATINLLTDEVERAFALGDEISARQVQQGEAVFGRPLTCATCTQGRGCCCQKIMVHMVEVLPLVRYLRRTGQQQEVLRAKLRNEGELMEGTDLVPWFDQGRPCLFLTAEQRCSIYAYRPTACRIYYTWSPADDCQPPTHVATVKRLREDPAPLQLMNDMEGVVQQMWGLPTDRVFLGTLPRMTAIVMEALHQPTEREFLRTLQQQAYPDPDLLRQWASGLNPFRRKLL
jgi:Fe-S-cluster containining protein